MKTLRATLCAVAMPNIQVTSSATFEKTKMAKAPKFNKRQFAEQNSKPFSNARYLNPPQARR